MSTQLDQAFTLTGSTCLLLIGVPGNILIIWTYLSVKRLQTHQNIFIVSLAVTDAILIGYLLPFNMVHTVERRCVLSRAMCVFNAFVAHVCFTSGVQTIMHISINRYVKICRTVELYIRIYTKKNILYILLSCWLMGPLFSIPLWKNNEDYFVYDSSLQMCIFSRFGHRSYTMIYQAICLGIPIIVTTVCYVKIQRHIWVTKRQISRHWNNGLAQQRFFQDLRSTKSHAIIFIAYLIFYLPFGVIATITNSIEDTPNSVHAMSIYFCYVNSTINCLIYGALNRNIRRAYSEALSCSQTKEAQIHRTASTRISSESSQRVNPLTIGPGFRGISSLTISENTEIQTIPSTPCIVERISQKETFV